MLIRIYWDGRPYPDVESPLGDFFANAYGKQMQVVSVPIIVEDADSYNCYWKMPFKKSARVEIINQNETKPIKLLYYNLDWIKLKRLPRNSMNFCARYRQEYPTQHGKDYLLMETTGKGYYVGTAYSVRTRSPEWFGEGDEKIYIDGETLPSIRGTGTEDYFLSAWGLQETGTPYFGTPYFDGWGRLGGHTSAYRWHIEDPIVFNKSLKVTFEHFGWISPDENKDNLENGWNEREDDVATVAYWYQDGPSAQFTPSTTAAERRLPNIERLIVWGKDYLARAHHGLGSATVQHGRRYLESGGQLLFKPRGQDQAWVEIPFEVKQKEPLRLILDLSTADDYGRWQPYLNGVRVGRPLDLFRAESARREFDLLDFWPEPGKYTLRLVCVGKNKESDGINLGLDSVRLRERRPRVKEWGWDKNKDWRKEQILYE